MHHSIRRLPSIVTRRLYMSLEGITMDKHLRMAFFFLSFFFFPPKSTTLLTHILLVIHFYLFLDKAHKQVLSLRIIFDETVLFNKSSTSRLQKLMIHEESCQYFVFD